MRIDIYFTRPWHHTFLPSERAALTTIELDTLGMECRLDMGRDVLVWGGSEMDPYRVLVSRQARLVLEERPIQRKIERQPWRPAV